MKESKCINVYPRCPCQRGRHRTCHLPALTAGAFLFKLPSDIKSRIPPWNEIPSIRHILMTKMFEKLTKQFISLRVSRLPVSGIFKFRQSIQYALFRLFHNTINLTAFPSTRESNPQLPGAAPTRGERHHEDAIPRGGIPSASE